ncbi:ThuA domain-containing protein [Filimonas effusa]|uniref:ThuA domain-containing protein n=2 Tax=Filimonas effusa TaxID=2508721 RepID=A0A4Q1D0C5_9BACT|nr:ThuA domain-containing protein [Filimonas effusa]
MLCLLALVVITCSSQTNSDIPAGLPKQVLVFSLTRGFHHNSIVQGNAFFMEMGRQHGFHVDTTTNAGLFTKDNLSKYAAVVWLNTTGDVLDAQQQNAFEQYIRSGGGYVGIHSASDTEYDWPWYNSLVGAYFASHPAIQEGKIITLDKQFPASAHLPDSFNYRDEIYDFKSVKTDSLQFLVRIDEGSYQHGKMGAFHPMSWYRNFDGGRTFYSAFGHTPESFSHPLISQHFLKGLQWAMGDLP